MTRVLTCPSTWDHKIKFHSPSGEPVSYVSTPQCRQRPVPPLSTHADSRTCSRAPKSKPRRHCSMSQSNLTLCHSCPCLTHQCRQRPVHLLLDHADHRADQDSNSDPNPDPNPDPDLTTQLSPYKWAHRKCPHDPFFSSLNSSFPMEALRPPFPPTNKTRRRLARGTGTDSHST